MKKHILLVLKTLVINSACVEASRTKEKKYNIIAVVIALLSLFLAVLPIGVTNFNKNGSAWMTTSNYSFAMDKGFQQFEEDLNDNKDKYTFTIEKDDKGNYLNVSNLKAWNDAHPGDYNLLKCTFDGAERVDFYVNTTDDTTAFNTAVTNLLKDRKVTLIAFGKRHVYGYLYQPGTTGAKNSFGGDYLCVKVKNFLDYRVVNNPSATYDNWVQFFNDSYIVVRRNNTWKQIGIMCGVNGGVLIFMGLMVFLLTRGKNNPFRIYSFWDGQKIAYYCAFTPSLLALLGFALPQMSLFLFPLTLGIRTMWLSMRTLRYTAPAKK